VADEIIKSAGLTEFELPLYRQEHGRRSGLMDVSNEAALAAGLELTGLDVTVTETRFVARGPGTAAGAFARARSRTDPNGPPRLKAWARS
jgi:hypothetical protein